MWLEEPIHRSQYAQIVQAVKVKTRTPGDGGTSVCFPLSRGEMLFIVAHKKSEKWNSNSEDWAYKCTPEGKIKLFLKRQNVILKNLDLHKLFVERKFYEKQDFIDEKMVKSVTRLSHLGIFQQHILPKWHRGRVAIIGDAAHATSPFMGQGANQAIQERVFIEALILGSKLMAYWTVKIRKIYTCVPYRQTKK